MKSLSLRSLQSKNTQVESKERREWTNVIKDTEILVMSEEKGISQNSQARGWISQKVDSEQLQNIQGPLQQCKTRVTVAHPGTPSEKVQSVLHKATAPGGSTGVL